ncbi:MAG: DUF1854 domain-containing protein [Tepidisphaeraceae bacterium]
MTDPFELITDAQGKLSLRRPGQEDVKDVRIRRSFPWSRPGRYISVRNSEGKELMLIDDINALGPLERGVIENSLRASVLIPKITRIDHVDVRFGFQQWAVQTDRGPIEFRVQEREDIRFMNDGRFSIKDADGNVYELAPLDKLDDHSRKAVEALI